jgi:hypothetical protein
MNEDCLHPSVTATPGEVTLGPNYYCNSCEKHLTQDEFDRAMHRIKRTVAMPSSIKK